MTDFRFPLTPAQQALYRVERLRRYWWPGLLMLPPHWAVRRDRELGRLRLEALREPVR